MSLISMEFDLISPISGRSSMVGDQLLPNHLCAPIWLTRTSHPISHASSYLKRTSRTEPSSATTKRCQAVQQSH